MLCCGTAAFALPAPLTTKIPITHVVIIMQENRSFDNYFGTYPGANGFPTGTCVPLDPSNPQLGCVVPFHDRHDVNAGGPHTSAAAIADLDNGITSNKFDGFVFQQTSEPGGACSDRVRPEVRRPGCPGMGPGIARHDVMGYHTDAEIPNYWAYAKNFVLQDNMFESVRSYSMDAHLYLSSEWSAVCKNNVLSTCKTSMEIKRPNSTTVYPWANLYQLLDKYSVSWKYYLGSGDEPDCEDGEMTCEPQRQAGTVNGLWNPMPSFGYIKAQGNAYIAAHNPDIDQFLLDIKNNALPQVSWIVPPARFSEHPANGITAGMEFVTSLVNAVMQSPYWQNTAIFITWDDWGGFYDHVTPPNVDTNTTNFPIQGYGLRVPGLMVSAWAKPGYIDHSVLSFDAYATLFEDLFLSGARLDPAALGQPDARPDIRDALTTVTYLNGTTAPVGKLINEFNFTQTPLPPLVLSTHIPTGIHISCASKDGNNPQKCTINTVTVQWDKVASGEVKGPFNYVVLRDGVTTPVCTTGATKCNDVTVPSGVHYYSVYSVDSAKTASPPSAGSEADVP